MAKLFQHLPPFYFDLYVKAVFKKEMNVRKVYKKIESVINDSDYIDQAFDWERINNEDYMDHQVRVEAL
jgi:hypothetical protein